MNSTTDWLMVIITGIYVLATIFICVANFKSAKATRDQTAEQQKQFKEENRALVNIFFEVQNGAKAVLHIQNNGKRIAKNVKINIDDNFINNISDETIREHCGRLPNSAFSIGIGQSWYCFLGGFREIEQLSEKILVGSISYSDDLGYYNEKFEIDLKQYFWVDFSNSTFEQACNAIKEQSKTMKQIANSLLSIARRLNCKTGDEKDE